MYPLTFAAPLQSLPHERDRYTGHCPTPSTPPPPPTTIPIHLSAHSLIPGPVVNLQMSVNAIRPSHRHMCLYMSPHLQSSGMPPFKSNTLDIPPKANHPHPLWVQTAREIITFGNSYFAWAPLFQHSKEILWSIWIPGRGLIRTGECHQDQTNIGNSFFWDPMIWIVR